MNTGHFPIPGEVTRREFAVYVVVARNRTTGNLRLYIGKTGDNREGCNPLVSRLGNHFSFNRIHSQLRNHLKPPLDDYDYDVFYSTLGQYPGKGQSRGLIDLTNEMERQVNQRAQKAFGRKMVLNPRQGIGYVSAAERQKRSAFLTREREAQLKVLLQRVARFLRRTQA